MILIIYVLLREENCSAVWKVEYINIAQGMQLPPLALLYPVCRSQLCVLRGMDDPHGALFIENMIYKENTANTQLSSDPSSEATGKRGNGS